MPRLLTLCAFAVVLSRSAFGADAQPGKPRTTAEREDAPCQVAVLHNGFSIQFSRREVAGPLTRLWLCEDSGTGYIGVPSEQIQSFEALPSAVPPAPAPLDNAQKTVAGSQRPAGGALNELIAGAAARHEIDPDFVASVVKAESRFNPTAVSPKGAQGLMQLMPGTAASLGVGNAFDPASNVEGGTALLRKLLDQYAGDAQKALAAYNAGPERVKQYGGVPPFRETRDYIVRVIEDFNRKKLQQLRSTAEASGK
ncbi:MAG: lytic transglycosylase domain-containing protein [Bryobacteraceae bacterium]|nr:lytic transglycosylase domain-containing protein [Bryobacteraceae bacterium]